MQAELIHLWLEFDAGLTLGVRFHLQGTVRSHSVNKRTPAEAVTACEMPEQVLEAPLKLLRNDLNTTITITHPKETAT